MTPPNTSERGWTKGEWRVRKREVDGELVDCFVTAPDVNGFAYDAEILGEDEYRDGIERKLADCQLIAAAPTFADIAARAQYRANELGGDYSDIPHDELYAFMVEYDAALAEAQGQ